LANVEEDIFNSVSTLCSVTVSVTHTWFGWTADKQVLWISPVITAAPFGMGKLMIHLTGSMYFLDAYGPTAGASSLSANRLTGYATGGAFPFFTAQMYHGLGIGWASSLLGFVSLVLAPLPLVFFKWGPHIRRVANGLPIKIK
jgi:hypothetical protein